MRLMLMKQQMRCLNPLAGKPNEIKDCYISYSIIAQKFKQISTKPKTWKQDTYQTLNWIASSL